MNRLKDKVCIITGSASGLGKSIARKFGEEGAVIAVLDFNAEEGQAFDPGIVSERGNIHVYTG